LDDVVLGLPGLSDCQSEIYREEGKDHLRIEALPASKDSKDVPGEAGGSEGQMDLLPQPAIKLRFQLTGDTYHVGYIDPPITLSRMISGK
jgi:hypothetical protein